MCRPERIRLATHTWTYGPDTAHPFHFCGSVKDPNAISQKKWYFALSMAESASPLVIAYTFYIVEHPREPYGLLLTSLGALPLATALLPGRIAVNQFGYLGGGLRRLLLLPVRPSSLLRSASYTCTLLSLAMLPVALTVWSIVVPYPFDWRMIVMLACSALTGIFFFHAAGAWVSVYDPSHGNYFLKFGNDQSFGGFLVFMANPVGAMAVPGLVGAVWPSVASPASL